MARFPKVLSDTRLNTADTLFDVDDPAVFDPAIVDVVATTVDGTTQLFVVCDDPWTGSDEQITSLQHKIHNYVEFALDGQMAEMYPDTIGTPWEIIVRSYGNPLDPRTADVLERTRPEVASYGGKLVVDMQP